MDFKKSFCWRSKLSNADDIISAYRPDRKKGMENDNLWSKIRTGLGEPADSPRPPTEDSRKSPPPGGHTDIT